MRDTVKCRNSKNQQPEHIRNHGMNEAVFMTGTTALKLSKTSAFPAPMPGAGSGADPRHGAQLCLARQAAGGIGLADDHHEIYEFDP